MKKFLMAIFVILSFSTANVIADMNIGLSLMGGKFEAKGAKEMFKGAHSSGSSPGDVTKNTSSDGDTAEGGFALASIFLEKELNEKASFGVDWVPHSLETETTENIQNFVTATGNDAKSTNTVQVDFENLLTLYAKVNLNENIYAKVGYVRVDVITNEKLATGGAYDDTNINGYTVGLGFNKDLADSKFVRLEASYLDLDGATLTNKNDSTKSVSADGVDGYGAKISIGKSF